MKFCVFIEYIFLVNFFIIFIKFLLNRLLECIKIYIYICIKLLNRNVKVLK